MTAKEIAKKAEEMFDTAEITSEDTLEWLEKEIIGFANQKCRQKCKEQRVICNKEMSRMECGKPDGIDFGLINAPEPEM